MPMPPPPPPGLPPPGPPPPPVFNPGKSKGGGADNRGALLQSIRQGARLKKTVTVDKSAPAIAGRVGGANSKNDVGRSKPAAVISSNSNSAPASNGMVLGGLFAGGMPKLRPTGRLPGTSQPSLNVTSNLAESTRKSPEPSQQNSPISTNSNVNQLNEVLRRQMSTDIKNRGPPPQPPTPRNNNNADSTDSPIRPSYNNKNNTSSSSSTLVQANKSTLHQRTNNSFLHQSQQPNNGVLNSAPNSAPPRPAISHGKPNLAPKPPPPAPSNKPATPPKKLIMNGGRVPVSRAQSMRVPRSPPVAPPSNPPFPPSVNGKEYGTMRGVPSAFHQSQENLSSNHRPTMHHIRNQTLPMNLIKTVAPQPPALNSRPLGPPPSRPTVPPPPSRTGSNMNLKAPLSPPPPPPIAAPPPLISAPPPPPHRMSPAPPPPHSRPPPAIPSGGPPPPPVRNSSMRNGAPLDFDTRFSNLFHPVNDLPQPGRYQDLTKVYNNKNGEVMEAFKFSLNTYMKNKLMNIIKTS